jgi:hypothetical protein
MLRNLTLVSVLLLGGCEYMSELEIDPSMLCDGPPRADEAIAIVERELKLTHVKVWWYGPQALPDECGHDSFPWGGYGCVSGMTGSNGSVVAWNGAQPASDTSLTHEIAHQKYGDPEHLRDDLWGPEDAPGYPYEVPGSIVGDIFAKLVAAGL